jgi:hypothetical protein
MVPTQKQLAWMVAACAAVVAQVVPQPVCRACDRPCCAKQAHELGPAPTGFGVGPAESCPLCAAETHPGRAETSDHSCRCQLDARQDQPRGQTRGSLPTFAAAETAYGLAADLPDVQQVLGVSREYLATSLAVPIRPPRILFGVWRN